MRALRHLRHLRQYPRYRQRRSHNAPAGTTVVNTQQQPGTCRAVRHQPRSQQAPGHEHPRAADASQQALQQQRSGIGEKTAASHEQAGQQ
jgi:hypothetical protein